MCVALGHLFCCSLTTISKNVPQFIALYGWICGLFLVVTFSRLIGVSFDVCIDSTGYIAKNIFKKWCLKIFKISLLYFWLCWIFLVVSGLSLVVMTRILILVASYCGAWTLGCAGFSSCGLWAPEHKLSSGSAWTELLQGNVGSSQSREGIGRWILNHWTTKEVLKSDI